MAYFDGAGVGKCVTEHRFHATRMWRFDFAWIEERVALEVEGGIWIGGGHSRGSGVAKDMEKYNAGVIEGWRILRVEPKNLCTAETVRMIACCLGRLGIKTINFEKN